MTRILWFRRDLRLADHPALVDAAADGDDVVALFVADPALLGGAGRRRARLAASLADLNHRLGGRLVVRSGDPRTVVPQVAAEVGAHAVHLTAETTPYGRRRDDAVARRLATHGIGWHAKGSAYAVTPGRVRKPDGSPYAVFTPFRRAWAQHGWHSPAPEVEVSWRGGIPTESIERAVGPITLDAHAANEPPAGERAALDHWDRWRTDHLATYGQDRNRPDLDTTSRLSMALKFGEIHPRTILADLATVEDDRFVTELAWREFYADVLWHRPDSAWSDLRPLGIEQDDPQASPHLLAWQQGRTGYPIVDAGQRQLLAEGWMHNRVRMISASFLVKDLHLPWQVGARHFLDHLLDGDLASNSHGWQWVAGTGTDAAPYFRVFNPVLQGAKFDPTGDYVRRWIPELRHLPGDVVHQPWRVLDGHLHGYPEPIVDHDEERRETLCRYERARSTR